MSLTPKLIALLATTALAESASAQSGKETQPYYESGPWTVKDYPEYFCTLTHAEDDVGSLRLSKSSNETAYFNYIIKERLDFNTPSVGIVWRFDDLMVSGRILAGRNYQVRQSSDEVETAFRKADTLTIQHLDKTVTQIDLTGSAAAFRKLEECADQYPEGTVPMVPPPAPPQPPKMKVRPPAPPPSSIPPNSFPPTLPTVREPKLDQPLPANRELTPIMQKYWMNRHDWKSFPETLFSEERIVGFTGLVNGRGRVVDCEVTQSSGARELDDHACDLVTRRARFEPRTDEKGNPVPARFSTSVRLRPSLRLKDSAED